ncbi:hypothetical protein XBFFR1_300008 [Xenorhabdus bovienii str. feltiae France]|nr:hypothetical protein XBFFR1_300008 [Xenorhabdus bovienii str. feltiae France]
MGVGSTLAVLADPINWRCYRWLDIPYVITERLISCHFEQPCDCVAFFIIFMVNFSTADAFLKGKMMEQNITWEQGEYWVTTDKTKPLRRVGFMKNSVLSLSGCRILFGR